VVERLAADLRTAFPDMSGFSVANLWRMKQLFLEHNSPEFLSQAVRELVAAEQRFTGCNVKKLLTAGDITSVA